MTDLAQLELDLINAIGSAESVAGAVGIPVAPPGKNRSNIGPLERKWGAQTDNNPGGRPPTQRHSGPGDGGPAPPPG